MLETASPKHNTSAWVQNISIDELKHDSLLGSGSYGIVSLGYHKQFGKVAYKPFKQHGINQTLDQREIDTLLMFNGHPNIVRIYGLLSEKNTSKFYFGFVMELMDYSLSTVMHNKQHKYNINHVVNWFRGVAAGLAVLHAHNVIHRDIRPDNVLTDRSFEQTRLCDFGLSTELRIEMTAGRGCDGYMAPELFNVTELCQYTSSCDMYSFGVLMKEVLSKRQTITNQCEESIMNKLNNLITSCCNVDANTRPTSQDTLHSLVANQEKLSTFKMSIYGSKEVKSENLLQSQATEQEIIRQQSKQGKDTQPSVRQPIEENTPTCDKCERNQIQLQEEIRKREEAERKLQLAEQKARSAIEEVGRVELERRETYRQLQDVERLRKVAEEEIALARDEALSFKLQLEEESRKFQEVERLKLQLEEHMHKLSTIQIEEDSRELQDAEEYGSFQFERAESNRNREEAEYQPALGSRKQTQNAEGKFEERNRQRREEEQYSQQRHSTIKAQREQLGRRRKTKAEPTMNNTYDRLLSKYGPYPDRYSSSVANVGVSGGSRQSSSQAQRNERILLERMLQEREEEEMAAIRSDTSNSDMD